MFLEDTGLAGIRRDQHPNRPRGAGRNHSRSQPGNRRTQSLTFLTLGVILLSHMRWRARIADGGGTRSSCSGTCGAAPNADRPDVAAVRRGPLAICVDFRDTPLDVSLLAWDGRRALFLALLRKMRVGFRH